MTKPKQTHNRGTESKANTQRQEIWPDNQRQKSHSAETNAISQKIENEQLKETENVRQNSKKELPATHSEITLYELSHRHSNYAEKRHIQRQHVHSLVIKNKTRKADEKLHG